MLVALNSGRVENNGEFPLFFQQHFLGKGNYLALDRKSLGRSIGN